MELILYIITLVFSLFLYSKKKYAYFICAVFLISSNFGGFVQDPLPLKSNDIVLCLVFIIFLRDRIKISTSEPVARYIKYLLAYYTINAVFSALLGIEDIIYSLMVLRFEVFFLLYYIYKKIPYDEFQKGLRLVFKITCISAIFYYLQYIGITGVLIQDETFESFEAGSRLNNIPLLTDFCLFYLLFSSEKIRFRTIWIVLFIGMVILSQNRGQILADAICIGYQMYLFKRSKKMLIGAFLGVMGIALVFPFLSSRFSSTGGSGYSFKEEAAQMYSIVRSANNDYSEGSAVIFSQGTGIFRALLVMERLEYMSERPWRLIFGIGSIHENSGAAKKLNFQMGNLWENGNVKKIDTSDVGFISHFVRYGFIYLILFLIVLYSSYKTFKRCNTPLFRCAILFLLSDLLQTFNGDRFSGVQCMCIMLLLMAQASNYSRNIDITNETKQIV